MGMRMDIDERDSVIEDFHRRYPEAAEELDSFLHTAKLEVAQLLLRGLSAGEHQ